MNYEEALAYLRGLQRFGLKPGLERTQELLTRLGRPDRRCGRIIHVTGTSGKGSVAAMVEATLRVAGPRVGLYTSPALERFTERIQVNRQEISPDTVAELVADVRPHVEAMVAEGLDQPTEFEVTTAVAFLHFARQALDWLVLEVGLGGRFDATTVADPVITCITNIDLDHTEWLGSTHERIAWDKAGIIKSAIPTVTGTDHLGALTVIRQVAIENDSVLSEVTTEDAHVRQFGPGGQMVDLLGARGWYRDVSLSLLGPHQAGNAAVALRVLELAGMTEADIRRGLANVTWPGRFELVRLPVGGIAVMDAAHNPAKCHALAEALKAYFPGRPVRLVLGVLADKSVTEMVTPLLSLACQTWVTTPASPRALAAASLAELCTALGYSVTPQPSVTMAVEEAASSCAAGDLLVVTGSFYTVGPARQVLRQQAGQE